MTSLSDSELAGIAERAELCFKYGDRTALRADDVAALLNEVRELQRLRAHLIAMNRQALDRFEGRFPATVGIDPGPPLDPELDPP